MKVCIIGNGLVSLTLAKALINKDIYVDIFYKKSHTKYNQSRTLGISKTNIEYFNKYISNIKNIQWNIKKIKIFTENFSENEILNFEDQNKDLFSIILNHRLFNQLDKELKKSKFFSYKKDIDYEELLKKNYKLIINCNSNHEITKKFFSQKLEKNYNSFAYTTVFKHKKTSNHTAVQIFTNNGPLAFLPISEIKTSVVYSLRESKHNEEINLADLIKKFNPKYEIETVDNFTRIELKSSNLRKYYNNKILAFGDLLHKLHPLAGQGFNMSIRDVKELIELIDKRIDLGLDIDSSICIDFQNRTKSKNYIFSKGVDWIYEFFNFESKFNNKTLSKSLKLFGSNQSVNKIFRKIADIGLYN